MARLSTHVLDTSRGAPAAGVAVELHIAADGGARRLVASAVTNADGRTDAPLLSGDRLETGHLRADVSRRPTTFAASASALPDPPFLGDVVIRVGIADPGGNYHVPLLLSPYGYSTYRGS